jgi:uncharacterized lipoprotein YmbA
MRSRPAPRIRARALLAVAWAVVWLIACGSSPTPRFYAINAIAAEGDPDSSGGLGIAVGPVSIPRYLQRPQIVTRKGGSRLRYDEFNRWGGSLESEVLRVLGENLAHLLRTDRIIVYPQQATFPAAYRVRVDFERFEGTPGEALELRARWVVLPGGGGDAIAVQLTTVREPLDGSSTSELVRAHGAALEALSREIAERIGSLSAP